MEIREIDVHDDRELRPFYETLRDAEDYERPGMPTWSQNECAVMFRRPVPSQQLTAYCAFESGAVVGAGFKQLTLQDNTDKAYVHVAVAPANRGRGIGSALARFLRSSATEDGRTTLLAEANISFEHREDHAYRRFAERHGYSLANVEVQRVLSIPVAEDDLAAWEADSAPHHTAYELHTFVGALPKELLESSCELLNQLVVDAPTGDMDFEAESMTPQEMRLREDRFRDQGRITFTTVALDRTGRVVAHTLLVVPAEDPGNVYQFVTMVDRRHRGHRLGLAVKARNLRRLQTAHPDRSRVITCNAETNGPMVDINERMGFRPVELLAEFQLRLAVGSEGEMASPDRAAIVPA
jgi:GNAT superfamily N-acetyltransferase